MSEKQVTIAQIYAKGRENLRKGGYDWVYAAGKRGPSVMANRRYLDSLFFEPKFFDPVNVDTSLTLFGKKLRTPVFCSAISREPHMAKNDFANIAQGVVNAGSFIMLGIGGSSDLQSAIDTGAPVVKIVKPYQRTELIYEKVRDAENRGCVAVGMDIDHFYGVLLIDKIVMAETFGPQQTDELKQLISQTKLPFIIKGVLSIADAEKAVELGASAIIVSNHASGSFDYTIPSIIALPNIVEKVGDKLAVLVDTGFENGSDVFKGLAFGAKGVGIASPFIFALAADGSRGVESLINLITAELRRNMAATGCPDLSSIKRSIICQAPPNLY
jgi:isopentenyl diphosphate isomerase/L-lactate dehydrogenase-like FMN-dependent dehydrogenase